MNRVAANLPARRSSSSEEITVEPDDLETFIDHAGRLVSNTDDEHEITKRVAKRLPSSWPAATGFRWSSRDHRPSTT